MLQSRSYQCQHAFLLGKPQRSVVLVSGKAAQLLMKQSRQRLASNVVCQKGFGTAPKKQKARTFLESKRSAQRFSTPCVDFNFTEPVADEKQTALQKRQRRSQFNQADSDWVPVANTNIFKGKQVKAVELKDKSFVTLYNVEGDIYCSDANSTAYKFPLHDAKIVDRDDGPAVEVPLDGTVYDLGSGKVLEWCPKNNPLRAILGTLKSNQNGENLKVYPTHVDEDSGQIYVKFV